MTAEIAIFNKEAVALAADSAVTVQNGNGQKAFPSANKIFRLLESTPIGIMVYGNATFMGYPWETFIKEYRKKNGTNNFATVTQCAEHFIEYLKSIPRYFPDEVQAEFIRADVSGYVVKIRRDIENIIRNSLRAGGKVNKATVAKAVNQLINHEVNQWKKATPLPAKEILDKFNTSFLNILTESIDKYLEKLPLSKDNRENLKDILLKVVFCTCPNIHNSQTSGVVFAGFGDDEFFPSVQSFELDGYYAGMLKYRKLEEKCDQASHEERSCVIPFAQSNMVYSFMEGIDPEYDNYIFREFNTMLDQIPALLGKEIPHLQSALAGANTDAVKKILKTIFNQFKQQVKQVRTEHFSGPIIDIVAVLPKSDLAALAESLVSLTSLKRRVSLDVESVGGPIDVAVISKGDGFIWIKRKHYFEGRLNPHFGQH